jgi:DNA-binding PadR family transcriptional regulator
MGKKQARITRQTEQILKAVMSDPASDWWGSRIAPIAGLKSGTLYPALMRMERLGWLTARWEGIKPEVEGRPRRRLYRLTGAGELAATEILRRQRLREAESNANHGAAWLPPKEAPL